ALPISAHAATNEELLQQIANLQNQVAALQGQLGELAPNRPVIASVTPISGGMGRDVVIVGKNFLATGNTVRFGNALIKNVSATLSADGSRITFRVPVRPYLACQDLPSPCVPATSDIATGTYPISIANSKGISSSVVFTVTGAGPTSQSSSITVTSAAQPENWLKATRHSVTWTSQNIPASKTVNIYLTSPTIADLALIKNAPIGKGSANVILNKLDSIPLGKYSIKIVYSQPGYANIKATSTSMIEVKAAADPAIRITSPISATQWPTGSTQRITWIANFVKRQVVGNGSTYGDVRVVPEYGVGTDFRSLNLSTLSQSDREALSHMTAKDLRKIGKLTPEQLENLSPAALDIPGMSPPGLKEVSKLSADGLDFLKDTDILGVGEAIDDAIFAPLDATMDVVKDIDPVANFIFGGLFGGDDEPTPPPPPRRAAAIIEAVSYSGGNPGVVYRLKATIVEKGKVSVSFKNVPPGQYKIRFTAKLRKANIVAMSDTFTILPQDVSVISPNGGESFKQRSVLPIEWKTTGGKVATVNVSLANGISTTTIFSGIVNNGKHNWTIPANQATSSNYRIIVTDSKNEAVMDESDAAFSIISSGVPLPSSAAVDAAPIGVQVLTPPAAASGSIGDASATLDPISNASVPPASGATSSSIVLDRSVTILPWTAPATVQAGKPMSYTLNWQGGPLAKSWRAYIHVIKADGSIVFADWYVPTPDTTRWNGSVSTTHSFTIPLTVPRGTYRVMAGLWTPASGSAPEADQQLTAGSGVTANTAYTAHYRYQVGTIAVTNTMPTATVWDSILNWFAF
ncbi:MAG: hypothetical protein JWO73_632, partial [Candidatus Taylorbacteria bacterium]|nr:hypothetical protein [Candidatus Taylorbacteria bacterium]